MIATLLLALAACHPGSGKTTGSRSHSSSPETSSSVTCELVPVPPIPGTPSDVCSHSDNHVEGQPISDTCGPEQPFFNQCLADQALTDVCRDYIGQPPDGTCPTVDQLRNFGFGDLLRCDAPDGRHMKVVTVDPYRNHLSDDRSRYTHEAAFDASTGDLVYLRMYRPESHTTTSFQDFYCCGGDYPSSIYWGEAVHLDCAWDAYYY